MKQKLILFSTFYFGLVVTALALLMVSFTIPSQKIAANVEETTEIFEHEGTYPSYGWYPRQIVLDNFTDSIMINTAYSVKDNSIRSVLLADRQILSNTEVDQIKNLRAAVEGTAPIRSSYARYWHGHLIFLRPLLAIMSYQGIRIVLHIALFSLFGLLLIKIIKRRGTAQGLALLAGAIAVDFFWVGQSIQFSSVFLIGLIMGLVLLQHDRKANLVFFVTGMMTALFDLLTAPLVGLGLLLITDKQGSLNQLTRRVSSWASGYAIFWASKWLLSELFLGKGEITNALGHVLNRTVTQPDANFSQLKAIWLNLMQLIGYARLSQIIVGMIGLVMLILFLIYRKKRINYRKLTYWLIIGLLPYGWYLAAANHSYLHVWYTYRDQFMAVAAGIMVYAELVAWPKNSAAQPKAK